MPYDCFLSYASADLASAESVHGRLVEAGFSVWFDRARLKPGYIWDREIEEGCEGSRVLLPLLTPRWKLSEWTRYETYGAEAIIPLVIEGAWKDIATPPLMSHQKINLAVDTATEAEWQRLFAAIRELLAREAPRKAARVAHLRYRPNPYFVGREEALNEIHEKLFTHPTAALTQGHVEAITALGGVGKTALARHYAEKFWRCYRQMFWVDCHAGLENGYARIHDLMRPEPAYAGLPDPDKAVWALAELSQGQCPLRLLILDNAGDEESVVRWIPKSGNCHTLITSRFTGWSPGIINCPVWLLKPEAAQELLLKRGTREESTQQRAAADVVARKLEYLPLALEQAAAYVHEQPPGFGFAEYLRLYQVNERELLSERRPGSTEYPASLYLTWRATIDKLPQGARAILRLHAFLASTPLPAAMYIQGAGDVVAEARQIASDSGVPPDADQESAEMAGHEEVIVRKWCALLARYSMIRLETNDCFSVHGLVQAVERHALGSGAQATEERIMELFLSQAPEPSWEPENRRIWDTLIPHAERLNQEAFEPKTSRHALLLHRTSMAYRERGEYQRAVKPMQECLEAEERVLGPDHMLTLHSRNDLAVLFEENGDYASAELQFRSALEARERVLGPEHPDALDSVNNLAALLRAKGDYAEAELLYRRALEARERVLGPEHPDTVRLVNNLANLVHQKGDHAEAEPLYRRALSASESSFGPEHPDTLALCNNLAVLLEHKGDHTGAGRLYRRALEARERVLGPEHPDTLTSVNNLATFLSAQGDFAGAEALCRRALETSERVLGPEHPNTLAALYNLGKVFYDKGDYPAGEPFLLRAVEAKERVLGLEHPDTIRAAYNLAVLLAAKGEYVGADLFLRRALEGVSRVARASRRGIEGLDKNPLVPVVERSVRWVLLWLFRAKLYLTVFSVRLRSLLRSTPRGT